MPYTVRVGSTLVTADTAAEAAELVRELSAAVPANAPPRADGLPPGRAPAETVDQRALAALHARRSKIALRRGKHVFVYWLDGKAKWGGSFETRELAEAARDKIADQIAAGETPPPVPRPKKVAWVPPVPVVTAVPAPAPIADPAPAPAPAPAREKRIPRRGIGPGSIHEHNGRWRLRVSIAGAPRFVGSFDTRAEAEVAQAETFRARLAGGEQPQFMSRSCGRCGRAGHLRRDCATPFVEARPPAADETERREKIRAKLTGFWAERRAALSRSERFFAKAHRHGPMWSVRLKLNGKQGWGGTFATEAEAQAAADAWNLAIAEGRDPPEYRKKVHEPYHCSHCDQTGHRQDLCPTNPHARRPAEGESTTAIGSPEYRAKISEAMRAAWERRRANGTAPPLRARPAPKPRAPRPARSPLAPAPRKPAAQLPPRCGRCIRVGHVEADCPNAGPAQKGVAGSTPADASTLAGSRMPEGDWGVGPAASRSGGKASSDEGAGAAPVAVCPAAATADQPDAPAPGELRPDRSPEADLTDLVDVPDAEPTVFPELPEDDVECHACGRRGHQSNSPACALSSESEDPTEEAGPVGGGHDGGATLQEIGQELGLTRERVRQIMVGALAKAARNAKRLGIKFEFAPERGSNAPEDAG